MGQLCEQVPVQENSIYKIKCLTETFMQIYLYELKNTPDFKVSCRLNYHEITGMMTTHLPQNSCS